MPSHGHLHHFDSSFTKSVIDATGPQASPRIRQVVGGLVQHLHDFMRENLVTIDEFMAAIELLNSAGRMSDAKRNEGQLLADVFGLESLADDITSKLVSEAPDQPTASAILGPFWRADAPMRQMGESIVLKDVPSGYYTKMHGTVVDFRTGKPVSGAVLDVWLTAPNGMYEQQDPDQPDMNLRGRFVTGLDGQYEFYSLRPTAYPIPDDGPTGKLLKLLDRHPWRPGHTHFIITAPNYKPLITQIYDRQSTSKTDDTTFAVKDSLIVDFTALRGDPKAQYELRHEFRIASIEDAEKFSVKATASS